MEENLNGVNPAETPAPVAPTEKVPESTEVVKTVEQQLVDAVTPTEEKPVVGPKPVVDPPKDVNKLQEQIDNLNTALKQEREKLKVDPEEVKKLQAELNESKEIIGKLKGVFVPPVEEKPEVVDAPNPDLLTKEQAEAIWEKKTQEQKQLDAIKSEIVTLEKQWDGSDGKPKYNDDEILQWQKEVNKLYLTPTEAFELKYRNEIVDWNVNQRLKGKPQIENVEKSGGNVNEVHNPSETTPKSEEETKNAVLEAINNANAEI